jgi:hypothetical protein
MTTKKNSDLSRDDISVIVSKMLQHHNQVERNRILEMLLEMDRDRTQTKIDAERLKSDMLKALYDLEIRQAGSTDVKQKTCQESMRERFQGVETAIEKSKPNYWAIIGLIVTLFLPFMGWIYSIQVSYWETKVRVAELQKEVSEVHGRLKELKEQSGK